MTEEADVTTVTGYLDRSVTILQTVIAFLLVVVLLVGAANLVATFVRSALSMELLAPGETTSLISTTVDIVLYLFIVVELYRTIIAYVEAESVVRAVIHAGMIAVVRQIITLKPGDYQSVEATLMIAGTYSLLLLSLLAGYLLVHRNDD